MNTKRIGSGAVQLRPLQISDKSRIAQLANNKKICDNVRDGLPHPYTEADAVGFIEKVSATDPITVFGIEHKGVICGAIGLHPQDNVYRKSAELGYWLGEECWGEGIATQAVQLITQYGFEQLKLIRIYAGVFAFNAASMRVLEKCEFKKEGISRKAVIKNEHIWDEHRFAITQ